MANELATRSFTREQLDIIKNSVCRDLTDAEFQYFLAAALRTGLDPFTKQIFAIKRYDSNLGKQAMTIQTGIDGYRAAAEMSGEYAGSDEPRYVEKDGQTYPERATVTVYRWMHGQRVPFTASARWPEYAQKTKDGKLTKFWSNMPYGQLAKCAEALALRKAFPRVLSAVYTRDEMGQADNPQTEVVVVAAPQDAYKPLPNMSQRDDLPKSEPPVMEDTEGVARRPTVVTEIKTEVERILSYGDSGRLTKPEFESARAAGYDFVNPSDPTDEELEEAFREEETSAEDEPAVEAPSLPSLAPEMSYSEFLAHLRFQIDRLTPRYGSKEEAQTEAKRILEKKFGANTKDVYQNENKWQKVNYIKYLMKVK